jgi:signal transduction histidine kinase
MAIFSLLIPLLYALALAWGAFLIIMYRERLLWLLPALFCAIALHDVWQDVRPGPPSSREAVLFHAFLTICLAGGAHRMLVLYQRAREAVTRSTDAIASLARFPRENPHPVLRLEADGTVLYANQGAEPLLSLLDNDEPAMIQAALWPVLRSGQTTRLEVDSSGRTWSLTLVPLAAEGTVTVYGHDITDLRVREAQIEAASKLEILGQMAGEMAHDFNNTLTVMLRCAEALAENVMPDSARHHVLLMESITRAASTVQHLLAFSRRHPVRPGILPLYALGGLHAIFRVILPDHIRLDMDDPGRTDCAIRADRHQLEQALTNLVLNARDAMPQGGILRIRCQETVTGFA